MHIVREQFYRQRFGITVLNLMGIFMKKEMGTFIASVPHTVHVVCTTCMYVCEMVYVLDM
jgi:hypothetical protein